jgi:hypothetical protein
MLDQTLNAEVSNGYLYVVDRDFGFAPNPFHGVCTLATCKPQIRKLAAIGDWILGLGGGRHKATGRLIFAMQVRDAISFDAYWDDEAYVDKRPIRNGSLRSLVGDNVYHTVNDVWQQEDSHHSNPDGTINLHNLRHDTGVNRVLVSGLFFYFGRNAPEIPADILTDLKYRNGRGYRKYPVAELQPLLHWLHTNYANCENKVCGDPFYFDHGNMRYSVQSNRII